MFGALLLLSSGYLVGGMGRSLSPNQEATFCNPKLLHSEFCNKFSLLSLSCAVLIGEVVFFCSPLALEDFTKPSSPAAAPGLGEIKPAARVPVAAQSFCAMLGSLTISPWVSAPEGGFNFSWEVSSSVPAALICCKQRIVSSLLLFFFLVSFYFFTLIFPHSFSHSDERGVV